MPRLPASSSISRANAPTRYTLVVLALVLFVARRLVHSPFGVSLQALRDNRLRAASIGMSVRARLVAVYTIAGAIAGAAGALLAQTTGFASLDVFDFHRSAEVLLVLVIGGTGYLYGGIFGAIVFKLLHDLISAWTPQYWNFWLGLFLVVLVLVGRERFVRPWTWFGGRGKRMSDACSRRASLVKRFGGLAATNDVSLDGRARRAPRADRPERRRQDDADQPAHRRARADLGDDPPRRRRHHHARAAPARATRRRAHVPDQPAVPRADAAVVARARGLGAPGRRARSWWRRLGRDAAVAAECETLLERFRLADVMDQPVHALAYGKRRLLEIAMALACAPRVLLLDEPVAGVPEGERQEIFETIGALPADVSILLIEHDMDLVFNFARTRDRARQRRRLRRRRRRRRWRRIRASRRSTSAEDARAWLSCCASRA